MDLIFSDAFVPRHACGDWHPFFIWMYGISSGVISIAYMAIPATLVWVSIHDRPHALSVLTVKERTHFRLAFALFIGFCGLGHLEGVHSFFFPKYHAYALWHACTAFVSVWASWVTWHFRVHLVSIV